MRWDVVPDKGQNVGHDVLCHRDNVRTRDLEDLEVLVNRGIEVDVVRADTGGDTEF